ncbi:hypothetical protein A3A49_02130 [Candidatus Curtissbacteria bacterium RIFCSPLOWO2_01_FULL_38_11b]|uniref:Uncharacterized protein n=1 Tax=Candidatus Curtissbacteria bacterium RIFCSPLOWO2_01_FULL_38_11b TaxID=1797725 RepID=A0A1F5H3E4_9BACT|nr:MAG: hypothetical protein A3A49_02130 [Candidatus Curtissbacteria bacterium RIFCSPLOWO2_01_FULL_38_11b]
MDQKWVLRFLILWIANSLLLVILSSIFAGDVVLGNINLPKPAASVLVGLILTLFVYAVPQVAKNMQIKLKDDNSTALAYFVVNAIGLWVLKRLADFTGIGISSILFVIICASIVSLVEVGVDKYTNIYLKKFQKS